MDLSDDIPKVYVSVTGGHLAFIYHDAEFKSHFVISKIRKNIFQHIKEPEDYTHLMKINGKPIQLIYKKQDFVNESNYQTDDRVKNTWLVAEGDSIFAWQLKGTIGIVTHIAGSDTKLDFENLVSKGEEWTVNDTKYNRQLNACPHPIVDTILDESDIIELNKQDILTSLSPEDALGIILERVFTNNEIKEEYNDFFQDIVGSEGFLNDLRQQISHLDELKSCFDNNLQTSATLTFK